MISPNHHVWRAIAKQLGLDHFEVDKFGSSFYTFQSAQFMETVK